MSVQYADNGKPVTLSRTVTVHAGKNEVELPFEIIQPKLWYPAGYGDQPLYEFTAQVGTSGGVSEERKTKAGLRSIVCTVCWINGDGRSNWW